MQQVAGDVDRIVAVAVDPVAVDRVAHLGEVDADLVVAAGLRLDADQRGVRADALLDLPLGDRLARVGAAAALPALLALRLADLDQVAAVDAALARVPADDREVGLLHPVLAEVLLELG